MKKYKMVIINVASFLLIVMFACFLYDQLRHFEQFQSKMQRQVFSPALSSVLSYIVPSVLIITIILLVIPEKRFFGLLSASLLMFLFTSYVSAVLLGLFNDRPCACISVVKDISWEGQLYFNIAFLLIAAIGFSTYCIHKQNTNNIIYADRKGEGAGIGC